MDIDRIRAGEQCVLDEDKHTEFKMHMKHSLMEIPTACQFYDHGRPVRKMQPTSKTISAFLNTEGGTIYVGIDDDAIIRGMQLTDPMKDHFILSLNHCLSQFTPPVPPELVQVQFLKIDESGSSENAEDVTAVPPVNPAAGDAANDEDDSEAEFQRLVTKEGPRNHLIGRHPCPCENLDLVPKLYLVVIELPSKLNLGNACFPISSQTIDRNFRKTFEKVPPGHLWKFRKRAAEVPKLGAAEVPNNVNRNSKREHLIKALQLVGKTAVRDNTFNVLRKYWQDKVLRNYWLSSEFLQRFVTSSAEVPVNQSDVHKSPDGTIYQNEEGLAYRRLNGSNQMMTINVFMHVDRIIEEEEGPFRRLFNFLLACHTVPFFEFGIELGRGLQLYKEDLLSIHRPRAE